MVAFIAQMNAKLMSRIKKHFIAVNRSNMVGPLQFGSMLLGVVLPLFVTPVASDDATRPLHSQILPLPDKAPIRQREPFWDKVR
jgi:hypothetical protein